MARTYPKAVWTDTSVDAFSNKLRILLCRWRPLVVERLAAQGHPAQRLGHRIQWPEMFIIACSCGKSRDTHIVYPTEYTAAKWRESKPVNQGHIRITRRLDDPLFQTSHDL